MNTINFLEKYQKSTQRNYLQRVIEHDKAACASVATQWGQDYWDGDRCYGYGGYHYDGRWKAVAEDLIRHYHIQAHEKVLDIGCGKGFLLYEMQQLLPGLQVHGLDISHYGLRCAPQPVRSHLVEGNAVSLPWADQTFDFVFSINTFHNLRNFELKAALLEMQRVGKSDRKWLCIESFRNEREKVNLLYWQLTCRTFLDTEEWLWLCREYSYTGDLGFIFFE